MTNTHDCTGARLSLWMIIGLCAPLLGLCLLSINTSNRLDALEVSTVESAKQIAELKRENERLVKRLDFVELEAIHRMELQQPKKVDFTGEKMIDHALAKIRVLDAASAIAKRVKDDDLSRMPEHCARLIRLVKTAVRDFEQSQKQSDPVGEDDRFFGTS